MNAGTLSGSARIIVAALVLTAAVVLGVIVGNAIGQRGDEPQTNLGYPPGWRGGAAVGVSRTADASFSLEALQQLNAIRILDQSVVGESANDASDYALRHPSGTREPHRLPGSGQRKAASDGDATLTAPTVR